MVTQATKVDFPRAVRSLHERDSLADRIEAKRAAIAILCRELDELTAEFLEAELAAHQHVTDDDVFAANAFK